jgi:peptidoglycan-associated lipoprotein
MVRKYYQSLGLEPKRMGALSYGKEKPSCFESSEGCWSKNRRGETKISAPAVGQSGKKDE